LSFDRCRVHRTQQLFEADRPWFYITDEKPDGYKYVLVVGARGRTDTGALSPRDFFAQNRVVNRNRIELGLFDSVRASN
jgi:hypothetical protein